MNRKHDPSSCHDSTIVTIYEGVVWYKIPTESEGFMYKTLCPICGAVSYIESQVFFELVDKGKVEPTQSKKMDGLEICEECLLEGEAYQYRDILASF